MMARRDALNRIALVCIVAGGLAMLAAAGILVILFPLGMLLLLGSYALDGLRFLAVRKNLRELGWTFTTSDLIFGINQIRGKDLKYVMRKEDFLVTPQYRSDRKDIQNILACIEFSKHEERSREVYDAIRPYIEEHERERGETPRQ